MEHCRKLFAVEQVLKQGAASKGKLQPLGSPSLKAAAAATASAMSTMAEAMGALGVSEIPLSREPSGLFSKGAQSAEQNLATSIEPSGGVQAEAPSRKYRDDAKTPPRQERSGRFPAELQVTSAPPPAEGSSQSLEDCSLMQAASLLHAYGPEMSKGALVSPLNVLSERKVKEGADPVENTDGSIELLSSVEMSEDVLL
jgi:hypothetical protein